MDLSFSMNDDLDNLKTLGSDLGMWYGCHLGSIRNYKLRYNVFARHSTQQCFAKFADNASFLRSATFASVYYAEQLVAKHRKKTKDVWFSSFKFLTWLSLALAGRLCIPYGCTPFVMRVNSQWYFDILDLQDLCIEDFKYSEFRLHYTISCITVVHRKV